MNQIERNKQAHNSKTIDGPFCPKKQTVSRKYINLQQLYFLQGTSKHTVHFRCSILIRKNKINCATLRTKKFLGQPLKFRKNRLAGRKIPNDKKDALARILT